MSTVLPPLLPISVIIISDRVGLDLKRALKSCPWAAERIVVLTAVVELPGWLGELSTKVANLPPITDFSQTRNQAAELAHQDWLFFLDSDEEITPESYHELVRAIQVENVAGYWVKRQDVFYNRIISHGELLHFQLVRLVRRGQFHFERPVHEVARVAGVVKSSQILLRHYPHPTVTEFIERVSRYASQEATYRFDQSQPVGLWQVGFYPVAKFWWLYGMKCGWLDGWPGFVYSFMMALHSLLVRVYLREKVLVKQKKS